jgi:hypothetical protein
MEQELQISETHIPEARYRSLQKLVGELLVTNQKLRLELADLKQKMPIARATHPLQHQDR